MAPRVPLQILLIVSAAALLFPINEAMAVEPLKVALVGIFNDAGEGKLSPNRIIEADVMRRLERLGFKFVPTRTQVPTCHAEACLPAVMREAGADIAMTGVVFRSSDLCTANLWVYASHQNLARSADIRCHVDSPESLSLEFADQAGRLTEPSPEPSPADEASKIGPTFTTAPPFQQANMATSLSKPLWPWDWKRKAVVYGLGVSLAGLLGATIAVWAMHNKQIADDKYEAGKVPDSDPPKESNPVVTDFSATGSRLAGLSVINAALLGLTFAIPSDRR